MGSPEDAIEGATTEEALREIWQDVLGESRVGYSDNFFDLGGHSLLLHMVREEMQKRMRVDVSLVDLFTYPTISTVADHLRCLGTPGNPRGGLGQQTRAGEVCDGHVH